MRWPWKRPDPDPSGIEDADKRLSEAEANLTRAKQDWPAILTLTNQLHRKVRENHFGPKIAAALREPRR